MTKKIQITIVKEDSGYSASTTLENTLVATESESFHGLKSRILEALNLTLEGKSPELNMDDLRFEYDLESFFTFYRVINAKALSERIGMNQSLLAQYIKGKKKPSQLQIRRILSGVQEIGRELTEVNLLGEK
jgi:hypothetical protein